MLTPLTTQRQIVPDNRDSNIDALTHQTTRVHLKSVSDVKNFFSKNGLYYADARGRGGNIVDNIYRLPINCDCIYVFDDISFSLPEQGTYKFPFNYRFENCEVIGQGRLIVTADLEPDGPFELHNENDLKSLLGVYYPQKSIVWNIEEAERSGLWPSAIDVNLNEIQLNCDTAKPITLPKNAIVNNCWIEEGHLIIEAGVLNVNSENAIGEAGGPESKVVTAVGKAYSNQGKAVAVDGGISVALHDQSYAKASGPNARA